MAAGDPSASELFAEFLGRSNADFEGLCKEHPAQEPELRRLHGELESLLEVRGQLDLSGTVTEEIRRRHGAEADPAVTLDDEGPEPDFRSEVLQRLGGRGGAFHRYRLKDEIGRGGQGAVIRVWDQDLRRSLAMKVLLGKEVSPLAPPQVDSKKLGRFLEEAQVTGQLDHPGIVPVHELGLDTQGGPYFTMKLVKGDNLRTIFHRVRDHDPEWGLTRALAVMLKVCEAVSYAHSKGVVHRDLKPANVMVGRFGEVYVMDWGLARILDEEDRKDIRIQPESASVSQVRTERSDRVSHDPDSPLVTMEGDVVGTPAFMAPEQARGELENVGPLSDVYSIGAMLYELLAGHMPYVPLGSRLNNYAIWGMVQNGPPARLERVAKGVPAELAAICEKAMAREPDERYASAADLRADLEAFIGGRVVRAYATGPIVELRKWVLRNRALAIASAAAAVLLVVALGFMAVRSGLLDALRQTTEEGLRHRYLASLRAAAWSLEAEAYAEAREWLDDCPESQRHWEWEHMAVRLDQSVASFAAHEAAVTGLLFDPAGRLLSASTDGKLFAWNPDDGSRTTEFDVGPDAAAPGRALLSLAYLRGDEPRVTAAGGGELSVWAPDGSKRAAFAIPGGRAVHAAVPGTAHVVVAGETLRVDGKRQPNLALVGPDGAPVWRVRNEHGRSVLAVDPEGAILLVGARDGLSFRSVEDGRLLAGLDVERQPSAVAFDPASGRAAVGFEDGTLELWELTARLMGERIAVRRFEVERGPAVECLAFSPDGRWLVAGLSSGRLILASTSTLRVERDLLGHASAVRSVAFAPNGERFASGDEAGTVRLWLGSGSSFAGELDVVREGTIERVQVSADGTRVVSSGGGVIRVWDGNDGRPVQRWDAEAAAFDPTSNRLFLVREGRRAIVDCATGSEVDVLAAGREGALLVALAPETEHVALVAWDGSVELQPFGGPARTLVDGEMLGVRRLEFLPGGERLVAVGSSRLRAFAVPGGEELPGHTLEDPLSGFLGLARDPRGRFVAFSTSTAIGPERTRTGRVGVVDLEGGETFFLVEPRDVYGRDAAVGPVSIVFDPDGERLACSFTDGSIRLWERGSWDERVMRGPAEYWRTITFSPDGARVWAWTGRSTGIGVFDPSRPRWLLTLPVQGSEFEHVAFDAVHQRLLATTSDRRHLVFLDASLEHARALWQGVAEQKRSDRMLEAHVEAVLASEAQAEVRASDGLAEEDKERLIARLDWIGNPAPDELNASAWAVVSPFGDGGGEPGSGGGDLDLALREARAAVTLVPDLAEYRETLAWALLFNGRLEEAAEEATRVYELAADRAADFQDSMGLLRREIDLRRERR